jgi:hypothetical protein
MNNFKVKKPTTSAASSLPLGPLKEAGKRLAKAGKRLERAGG